MRMRVLTHTNKGKLLAIADAVTKQIETDKETDTIPSAYNCAPHHFMADIFPSSRYSLLRKFLECKVPMAAMKILLDVQKHS